MHLLHPTALLKLSFGPNWVQKNKNFHLRDFKRLFSNMDFNFAHFTNSNFAHFENEKSFGLIWVKLQNCRFHLQISISGI